MITLVIDTTTTKMNVAIINDNNIISHISICAQRMQAKILLPAIKNLLKLSCYELSDLDYIACSMGPGSFTGLKVGAATAKALAHVLKINIIGIPTLDIMATNAIDLYISTNMVDRLTVVPVINSRRGEVYSAFYEVHLSNKKSNRVNFNSLNTNSDYLNTSFKSILNKIDTLDSNAVVFGENIKDIDNAIDLNDYVLIDSPIVFSKSVPKLINRFIKQNKNIFTYINFKPFYLRKHLVLQHA
jgi:tRNA threonylcarbamoyl adenosine modification protein YeaZ